MDDERSKLDDLNNTLYSRTKYKDPVDRRSKVEATESPDVNERWQSPDLNEMLKSERRLEESNPFMKKIFAFAVIFFVIAVIVAGFVFFGGSNFISSKNVDITIVGPTSVSAGEVLELGLAVKNKNNADLDLANLSIQFPEGTRSPDDTNKSLTFSRDELGKVGAGDEVARTVRSVLFGTTGEVKEIKFSVEYKVKGSNATFYKEKVYDVTIGTAPVTLNITSPRSVTSGDNFTTELEIKLNSSEIMKNVLVKAEYPYGFSFSDSNPSTVTDENVWSLGDLKPGDKKKIQIHGRLSGENEEERTFRFYVGVSEAGSSDNFKTIITSNQNTINISRPAVSLNVTFNNEESNIYIVPNAQEVVGAVHYENNLPDKLINPRLEVRLSGSALDRARVVAQDGGTYDQTNNRIVWSIVNNDGTSVLSPGDDGRVVFRLASLQTLAPGSANRDINVQVVLTGSPASTPNKPITVSESDIVRVASQVSLNSKVLYSRGAFRNSGPIPPQADQETTYTVTWSAGNTLSDIKPAQVKARLGTNVRWLGANSTASEDITYDEGTNEVIWNLDQLSSGAGFSLPTREVSFQLALTPSEAQVGSTPILVNNIIFQGTDASTTAPVTITNTSLTTRMPFDPTFVQGDDVVVK